MKIFVFLYGICFGSFALCISQRLAQKKTLFGRSRCDRCNRPLEPLMMIPVLSYLIQRGRCAYCHHRLSAFYPFAEFGCGILFCTLYEIYGLSWMFIIQCVWCLLLLMIAVEDALSMEISIFLLIAAISVSFLLLACNGKINWFYAFYNSLIILLLKLIMVALGKLKNKEMMGDGDLWLMLCGCRFSVMGQLCSLLISCTSAILYALLFVGNRQKPFPFAPFLCFGYLIMNFATVFCPLFGKYAL